MEAVKAGDPQTDDVTCSANTIKENTVRSEPTIDQNLRYSVFGNVDVSNDAANSHFMVGTGMM